MRNRWLSTLALCICSLTAFAEFPVDYHVSFIGNASSNGSFAPYYISSNDHGIITQSKSAYLRAAAFNLMDTTKRFSYGFGVDMLGGGASKTGYQIYDTNINALRTREVGPANFWLQQLYGEVKYRGVFLTLGLKEHESALYNSKLGVGDFIESGNSRPVPEARIGFIDFQNVPFTNGWVQIQGEYSFGKPTDSKWLEDHYNYYYSSITTDYYYSYKRLYFRTKPSCNFSVTIGMQSAMQLGGTTRHYQKGVMTSEHKEDVTFKSIFHTIFPGSGSSSGNDVYYDGNSLGSWDFVARYRFNNGNEIKGYFQFPWEDGSGIGKLNGWDGIYGLEFKSAKPWYINGAVIEYIDFRNQSGPIHWAPGDHGDITTPMPGQATGGDNYYNNFQYNGYQQYGMSMGTPFVKSPIYNQDGYMRFTDNRIRGFQFGIMGNIMPRLGYRFLISYRYSLGTYETPALEKRKDTSAILEGIYDFKWVKGLSAKCQFAIDRGDLYNDNFGAMLTISYNGKLNF